ncbi:Hypothetical protein A7982_03053 [Minicystis rosea]|nr:Hypothetical protein A7982_03053 [Minicystis rosea]
MRHHRDVYAFRHDPSSSSFFVRRRLRRAPRAPHPREHPQVSAPRAEPAKPSEIQRRRGSCAFESVFPAGAVRSQTEVRVAWWPAAPKAPRDIGSSPDGVG